MTVEQVTVAVLSRQTSWLDNGILHHPLFDEDRIKCTLQKIFDYNVMRVKGGRMGAVNGMHPNGKVDETCMQSTEIWTGVTYSLAATMLLHGMEHQAFTAAEGIYISGWCEEGYEYASCFVSLYRSSSPSIIFPVHDMHSNVSSSHILVRPLR